MVKIELRGKLTLLDSDQHLWLTFLVDHFDQEWMLLGMITGRGYIWASGTSPESGVSIYRSKEQHGKEYIPFAVASDNGWLCELKTQKLKATFIITLSHTSKFMIPSRPKTSKQSRSQSLFRLLFFFFFFSHRLLYLFFKKRWALKPKSDLWSPEATHYLRGQIGSWKFFLHETVNNSYIHPQITLGW